MQRATKQKAIAAARALGLLPFLDWVRFLCSMMEIRRANLRFIAAHEDFAPPPLFWMHDMYRHTSYKKYWDTGVNTAETITALIDAHGVSKRPRVADWGCGLARVVRHLPDRYERAGFDYNAAAIQWCAAHIDGVSFHANDLRPPLPCDAGSFDALYALSVFTHLSKEGHEQWIGEIQRVLAPGGVFIGAFHMRPRLGQLLRHEQSAFEEGRLVIRGRVKEGSRAFTAYHPEQYLRKTLLRNFDIVQEPFELFDQSLIVARRR